MGRTAGILSIQLKPVLTDKAANIEKVKNLIEQFCDKTLDLVVIPEFFSTGVDHKSMTGEPEDTNGGETIETLSCLAKRFNTNIVCGSVIEKDGDKLYNTTFVLDRSGKIVAKYRKIHLYRFFGGTEDTYITPGEAEVVVELDFARIGLSTCFDIKYPMHFKKLIKMGAEIIVAPAAWCNLNSASEQDKANFALTWRSMNICRAAESLVYFVSSDQTGKIDNFLYAAGNSMIVSPFGVVEADAGTDESAIHSEINLETVRELKATAPVYNID